MKYSYLTLLFVAFSAASLFAQPLFLFDDFEGNGTITSWAGDDCGINTQFSNPHPQGMNPSATVLEYHDTGGQYANIRFDIDQNLELINFHTFSFKVYLESASITGNEPLQVSLKLQNNKLPEPWTTQCEIIKSVTTDEWQEVTFNFKTDNYFNFEPNSPPPVQRYDFNRVLIQINGENNNSEVIAYLDEFNYDGILPVEPEFNDLVWSDEFETDGPLNSDKWFQQTQLPAGGSWFNGEIQHYTNRMENSFVEDGLLKLVAKKETFTDQGHTKEYTSARLNSKYAFQYGKVEIRAKLPSGGGTWPALWMLGKNISEQGAYWQTQGFGTTPWPDCGEIDIMEHWGHNQNFVQSATHTPSSFGATENHGGQWIPTVSSDFHVYSLIWTEEKLIFSVDDVVHFIYNPEDKNPETWPFDAEQYLIFNIAIQPSIDPNFTESAMEVDYVRVYQNNPVSSNRIVASPAVQYYPNPVFDEFTIELENKVEQNVHVFIYGTDGLLVREAEVPAVEGKIQLAGLEGLTKGAYFVHFEALGKKYSLKLIKN